MVARVYVDAVDHLEPAEKYPWMEKGACAGKDFEEFFPHSKQDADQIKQFCNERCSVKLKCLAFAMAAEKPKPGHEEKDGKVRRHGIFGGLDGKERAALQKVMDKMKEGNNDGNRDS